MTVSRLLLRFSLAYLGLMFGVSVLSALLGGVGSSTSTGLWAGLLVGTTIWAFDSFSVANGRQPTRRETGIAVAGILAWCFVLTALQVWAMLVATPGRSPDAIWATILVVVSMGLSAILVTVGVKVAHDLQAKREAGELKPAERVSLRQAGAELVAAARSRRGRIVLAVIAVPMLLLLAAALVPPLKVLVLIGLVFFGPISLFWAWVLWKSADEPKVTEPADPTA